MGSTEENLDCLVSKSGGGSDGIELGGAEEEEAADKLLKDALAFSKVEAIVVLSSESFDCGMTLRTAVCNPSILIRLRSNQLRNPNIPNQLCSLPFLLLFLWV